MRIGNYRKLAMKYLFFFLVATALVILSACKAQPSTPTPVLIPTPKPGVPPITDFTPQPGLSKNTQVRDRYFKAFYLWKVPEGRAYTKEDTATPVETFTRQDSKIGMHVDALDTFVPGMIVSYRLDKRGPRGEGQEVSLASLINKPGVYDFTLDTPKDTAGYVIRVFLNNILVENLTFEVK